MSDKSVHPLSAREFEVCRLIADGLTNPEIADRLGVSKSTIGSHVENISRKLKTRNRVETARWYWRGRVATLA